MDEIIPELEGPLDGDSEQAEPAQPAEPGAGGDSGEGSSGGSAAGELAGPGTRRGFPPAAPGGEAASDLLTMEDASLLLQFLLGGAS